jgi:hypothetical protein
MISAAHKPSAMQVPIMVAIGGRVSPARFRAAAAAAQPAGNEPAITASMGTYCAIMPARLLFE